MIVVLRALSPLQSEHQAAMRATIRQFAKIEGPVGDAPALPLYEYIAYFGMQARTPERCLQILERNHDQLQEARESIADMDADEQVKYLHELVTCVEPRPVQDHYEIGYPAKFSTFVGTKGCQTESVRRYRVFALNQVLDDATILAELKGEDGSTGQRIRRTLSVSNSAHMASARRDIAACLEENPVWKNHILRGLEEIRDQYPEAGSGYQHLQSRHRTTHTLLPHHSGRRSPFRPHLIL